MWCQEPKPKSSTYKARASVLTLLFLCPIFELLKSNKRHLDSVAYIILWSFVNVWIFSHTSLEFACFYHLAALVHVIKTLLSLQWSKQDFLLLLACTIQSFFYPPLFPLFTLLQWPAVIHTRGDDTHLVVVLLRYFCMPKEWSPEITFLARMLIHLTSSCSA